VRARRCLLALCALGWLVAPSRARASALTDSVLVRVGSDLSGRAGSYLDVPITVDLRGAPGRQLGSYRAQLAWNPALLELTQVNPGNFAPPQANISALNTGSAAVTAVLPAGAGGVVTVFVAHFFILADTAQSPVTVAFSEMSATATSVTPYESLLPLIQIVQGTFCRSLGRWGDVNGDGQSNSLDALVALSVVVGLAVDTTVMTPALADVDGDGQVTSRDALIMLSYAVGLPVTGYRVLLTAAGACGTGAATNLAVTPDSVELVGGQSVAVLVQATDSAGRAVPLDSVSWTSSNPVVAGYDPSTGQVQGRSAGVATLTVSLGPGVQGVLKVSVIARRTTWYADVQRALNAPAQTGSQALPFQYIGDALALARDGDTVRVAGGTYEEIVSQGVSVALLGDSLNRPVLDPRGAPSWSVSSDAMDLGSAAAPLVVANLDVRAGGVYLSGHDMTVRNVAIEGLNGTSTYAGLELYSVNLTPAPPARSGPMRSGAPAALGNVLVDGVTVTADSTTNGILVDVADTAVIRNSSVTRGAPSTATACTADPYTSSGILVSQASVSVLQNNVVVNPTCQGIGVYDAPDQYVLSDVGRATVSRNAVSGAPGIGIGLGARLVALDHNAVRNTTSSQNSCCYTFNGIEVSRNTVVADSVTSLADTVVGVAGYYSYGLSVDSAASAAIDSLVVDSIGGALVEGNTGSGFYFSGARLSLTNSRVTNSLGDGVEAFGELTYLGRGNYVHNAQRYGIWIAQTQCDCSSQSPDSVSVAHDSIVSAGSVGIEIDNARIAELDSLLVDSANSDGIYLNSVARGTVRNAALRHSGTGIFTYFTDTLSLLGDTAQATFNGVDLEYTTDSVTIRGGVMDGNSGAGIYLGYQSVARIDSVTLTNNAQGLYLLTQAGARVQRSRFQGNAFGFYLSTSAGMPSSVSNSNFLGNTAAGAWNDAYAASGFVDTLFAGANYWNDPAGPTCDSASTGFTCPGTTGDAIGTAGVTFAGWLSSQAPTPAPPVRPLLATASRVTRFPSAVAVPHAAAPSARPVRSSRSSLRSAVQAPPHNQTRAVVPARAPHAFHTPWHGPERRQGIRVTRRR